MTMEGRDIECVTKGDGQKEGRKGKEKGGEGEVKGSVREK